MEKSSLFEISKLSLLPGLVGLVVLDSFALQTPLITTNYLYHSPEIHYLTNNYNGVITENSLNSFIDKAVKLPSNNSELNRLKYGCSFSTQKYSILKMVGYL